MITPWFARDFVPYLSAKASPSWRSRRGLEAVQQVRSLSPDIVVMDISMPSENGLNATREIHKTLPAAKVILLTATQ